MTGPMWIGSFPPSYMTLGTSMRPITTMNMQPQSAPFCTRTMCLGCGKTRGFPRWSISGHHVEIRTNVTLSRVTRISTIAQNSANAGINPVSIQFTTANRCRFLPAWCKRVFSLHSLRSGCHPCRKREPLVIKTL